METKSDIASRLSQIRKKRGLTQQQLADLVGSHWITISKLERGVIRITEDWMDRLAVALDVEIQEFLPQLKRLFTVEMEGEVFPGGIISPYKSDDPHTLSVHSGWLYPDSSRWFYANTSALVPWFRDGDALCASATDEPPEKFIGRLCWVLPENAEARIGILTRGSKPGLFQIDLPSAESHEDIKVAAIAPIVMAVYDVGSNVV